jgi:hypothetical protein
MTEGMQVISGNDDIGLPLIQVADEISKHAGSEAPKLFFLDCCRGDGEEKKSGHASHTKKYKKVKSLETANKLSGATHSLFGYATAAGKVSFAEMINGCDMYTHFLDKSVRGGKPGEPIHECLNRQRRLIQSYTKKVDVSQHASEQAGTFMKTFCFLGHVE